MERWAIIIAAIAAFAAIAQVAASVFIAWSISRASKLSESLQISREIDTLWQEYNKMVVTDQGFLDTLRHIEGLSESENETKERHYVFYILNIIYIAWTAQKSGRDQFDHSHTIIRDHLSILFPKRQILLSILEGNRGYNKHFVNDCRAVLSDTNLR